MKPRSTDPGRSSATALPLALAMSLAVACGPGSDQSAPSTTGTTQATTDEPTMSASGATDPSASGTGLLDGTSTGSGLVEYVGFWAQGPNGGDAFHRTFDPCGMEGLWSIQGAVPDVDVCTSDHFSYLRVLGEVIPGRPGISGTVLVVSEVLEGPCWKHTCDGGDPCDCSTFAEVCNSEVWPCDLFKQDCPEGEKCMPWSNNGSMAWNDARCAPFDPAGGQPGDPCTIEGNLFSGADSCALGSMCWDVDPSTNSGTCVELCNSNQCNPEPHCTEAGTECAIAYDGALTVCLPPCDPLAADPGCAPGYSCEKAETGSFCFP